MTATPDDRVSWLVATEQIRQLASRYAVAFGRRDLAGVAELFVSDVQVGESVGRAALAAEMERLMEPIGMAILHVTNQVIDITSPTEATGVVGSRAELEIDGELIVQMIEYGDDYRKVGDDWLFVRRRHGLWYGAAVGVNPFTLAPANWPASPIGLGDLAERAGSDGPRDS